MICKQSKYIVFTNKVIYCIINRMVKNIKISTVLQLTQVIVIQVDVLAIYFTYRGVKTHGKENLEQT